MDITSIEINYWVLVVYGKGRIKVIFCLLELATVIVGETPVIVVDTRFIQTDSLPIL